VKLTINKGEVGPSPAAVRGDFRDSARHPADQVRLLKKVV